eukprot:snap_masked-scaffold_21-processed-gene-0.23-mRNA-1 protein AED:1.00 eAED:1.00 QI:0/0/0/0/1/1/2/0/68
MKMYQMVTSMNLLNKIAIRSPLIRPDFKQKKNSFQGILEFLGYLRLSVERNPFLAPYGIFEIPIDWIN